MSDGKKIDLRCCDNLELMAEIPDNTIDLIYCDILYGTGRKFADYQDLKPIRSEIESHYIPRIKEMNRVLKSTGSIYIHCDWHINHWIRCIMDDIFGYNNFRNEIIWCYTSASRVADDFPRKHDNILRYSKSTKVIFNKNNILVPYDEKTIANYKKGLGGSGTFYSGNIKETEESILKEGKIPEDWWEFAIAARFPVDGVKRTGYTTEKPKALIERIIKASSNEGDLVADFYAGSFTTAEVCKELNRNFIGCDINPNAYEIGKKRVADFNKNFEQCSACV